jgi:hypothetical protein
VKRIVLEVICEDNVADIAAFALRRERERLAQVNLGYVGYRVEPYEPVPSVTYHADCGAFGEDQFD